MSLALWLPAGGANTHMQSEQAIVYKDAVQAVPRTLCTRMAATALSTPPDRAQMACAVGPTCHTTWTMSDELHMALARTVHGLYEQDCRLVQEKHRSCLKIQNVLGPSTVVSF